MRVHRNYDYFQLWAIEPDLRWFVCAKNLVAARLEPVIRQMLPHTTLDLVFRYGERYLCVPLIIVDSAQVVLREADRLIWPAAVARAMNDNDAYEIETILAPWLRALTLARVLDSEQIRHFGTEDDRRSFERAREMNFVGASMLEKAVHALGPYVFGMRYAFGKNVLVTQANDGVQGAVYLARHARGVRIDQLDVAQTEVAARWFSWPPATAKFGSDEVLFVGPSYDRDSDPASVATTVVRVDGPPRAEGEERVCAEAYPLDLLFTFDTFHGPATRKFSIHAHKESAGSRPERVPSHAVLGGSGGRVLFGMRRDWESSRDSDSDSALALAAILRAEGLAVDISTEPSTCDFRSYDVVHCFNLIEAPYATSFLRPAKRAGVRTILTATFTDITDGMRTWGAETSTVPFSQEIDEAYILQYLAFFARRALVAPGWEDGVARGPVPGYPEMVREALSLCDVVIAESREEGELIRKLGFTGDIRVILPFVTSDDARLDVAIPVGFERFALQHAPLEPRNNQLLSIRAARQVEMPLILAGQVRDMSYAARLRETADDRIVMIDPTPAQTSWLYARATTIIDPRWYAFGTQRLWRAMLSGARVGASGSGWGPTLWPGLVTSIDPASVESIAHAISGGDAEAPPDRKALARVLEPSALLRNILRAYVGQPAESVLA